MHNFMALGPAGKAIAGVVALAVIGAGVVYLYKPASQTPGVVACTEEAMQCPDGSFVGRSGANCEFMCPATTTIATTTQGAGDGIVPYNSGIRGTIMLGPTCPVERDPPDPRCADKPYSTIVEVFRTTNLATPFAVAQSDASGTFTVSLPPGNYVVKAGGNNFLPSCSQNPTAVGASRYTNVIINCDTGIR